MGDVSDKEMFKGENMRRERRNNKTKKSNA
jgi:hypothetical protein